MPQIEKNIQSTDEEQKIPASEMPVVSFLRFRKILIIFAHIGVFAVGLMLSFVMAYNMRFEAEWFLQKYPIILLWCLVVKIPVFAIAKQYRGWWRYVSVTDLVGIAGASLASTLIIVITWFVVVSSSLRPVFQKGIDIPQSVLILDLFATFLILGGVRMAIRLYFEEYRAVEQGRLKRLLIIGAGNAGEALLREIHRMEVVQYEVIGLIDDDPAKQGINIHGIAVLGMVESLAEICEQHNVDEIAIAVPSASHQKLRRIIQICEGTKIRFRTVPSITDIASGKLKVSQIRDVDINDLLGREAVQLETDLIAEFAKDKVLVVTGAGGSIGSEMCRQVCHFQPKLLLLLEQAENPLFFVENELRKTFSEQKVEPIICDIADAVRVDEIFEKYKPHIVIHAAAHKHVPLMEQNPCEAIKNNIIGTKTVADAASKHGSTDFVMISTDKAVNPTSIMGSSKRIAEMYIQDLNLTSGTNFTTVRFGNVLGSNGSVVPIFNRQIAQGGPVTVTHPDMQRYFMTIPEASQLVLQAAAMGKGGEIFLLDMGEPVKIVDLARELITLSGFRPGEDIEITFSGTRPGEKLFEELSIKGEDMIPTKHPKIGIWKSIPVDRQKIYDGIDGLLTVVQANNKQEIINKIKVLVPEYIGNNDN